MIICYVFEIQRHNKTKIDLGSFYYWEYSEKNTECGDCLLEDENIHHFIYYLKN